MRRFEQHKPVLLALLISILGGFVAFAIGMPLPWMVGPMIGNTIAAISGVPIKGPMALRIYVIPIIGVMLGSAITPALFAEIGPWVATLIALPICLAAAAAVSFFVYRRIGKYDPVTAYYAAMPGGLNEMMLMGAEAGGDERKIALAHACRVLLVIFCVVAVFSIFFGVRTVGTGTWIAFDALSLSDYGILGLCAIAGVWAGRKLRLPAAPVFGPMILSGLVHVAGWVTLPPPTVLVIIAQMVMGTVIGSRFVGTTWREVGGDIRLGLLSSILMLLVAAITAEGLVRAGVPLSQAFLGFAPGGLTEMSLLALAMDQDPAYVSTVHLIRITMVIAAAPLAFRFLRGLSAR